MASCYTLTPNSTETLPPSEISLPASTGQTVPISQGMKDINETRLYFKTIGSGGPVIFLHGSGGSHRYFLPFVEQLAGSYQLVFYDRRGTGLSDGQLDMGAITIDQFVDDLEALRVAFGFERVSLVGHSWGAIIALSYAIKYQPHLDRLVLMDSIPVNRKYLSELAETLQQRVEDLDPEAQKMITTTCGSSLAKLTPEQLAKCNAHNATLRFYDPEKAETIDSTMDQSTIKNANIIQSLIRTDFNRIQSGFDAKLQIIQVPTLILHGDFDPIPTASSEYIHGLIPTSQLLIITESGHFPFIEQPEQFFTAVRQFMQP